MSSIVPCSVTLIRPPETGLFAQEAALHYDGHADYDVYDDHLESWLEAYRKQIFSIAGDLAVPVILDDVQLFQDVEAGNKYFPGRKTLKKIQESDIVTSIDPSSSLLAYMCSAMKKNPVMRCVLAHSSTDWVDKSMDILGSASMPLMVRDDDFGIHIIHKSRFFVFPYCNEDRMQRAMTGALQFLSHERGIP